MNEIKYTKKQKQVNRDIYQLGKSLAALRREMGVSAFRQYIRTSTILTVKQAQDIFMAYHTYNVFNNITAKKGE